jgi:aryl-alcohol dehydrogenase-like predicted oxidoreductase
MEAWQARNANPRTWAVIDAVREIADTHGASASQVALAWLGARPAVTSVILGVRSLTQLADNLAATELELTPVETERLTTVSAPQVDPYPYGAAGVGQRNRNIDGGR